MGKNREKTLEKWNDTLDKLIRIDGYDLHSIRGMLNYITNDDFWKMNFLTLCKFRTKTRDGLKKVHEVIYLMAKKAGYIDECCTKY